MTKSEKNNINIISKIDFKGKKIQKRFIFSDVLILNY